MLKFGKFVPPKHGGRVKSHLKSLILNYETTLPQNMFKLHLGVCLATPTILATPQSQNTPKIIVVSQVLMNIDLKVRKMVPYGPNTLPKPNIRAPMTSSVHIHSQNII